MPWVTEEEIQAAKNMTAYEYLRTHQAQRLQKTRTRNEWQLTDHDSFKINELSSKWHWKSRDIGGVSALRFLIEVDGMKFKYLAAGRYSDGIDKIIIQVAKPNTTRHMFW